VSARRRPNSPEISTPAACRPTAGNHRWTGRANGSDTGLLKGGNFGYDDGSVQWRTLSVLRPRLIIDRTFQGGSTRPTRTGVDRRAGIVRSARAAPRRNPDHEAIVPHLDTARIDRA
jgi:hypothetical protein